MSTISHSRLFKATRRFIVAEITLIIVIVILFAWSSYVLYKLFASDSDSLFGFNFKTSSPTRQHPFLTHHNQTGLDLFTRPQAEYSSDRIVSQSQTVPVIDQASLHEQLASYKDQILKELLTRQRKLLGDDTEGRLQSLLGLNKPREYSNHNDRSSPVINELQQWTGGYRMPTSLDYLFENKRQPATIRNQGSSQPSDKPNLTATPMHSKPNNLVYLEDAPSLMQLSPTSDSSESDFSSTAAAAAATTTTIAPEALGSPPADGQDGNQINDEQQPSQQDESPAITTTDSTPVQDSETTTIVPPHRDHDYTENHQQVTTPSPSSSPETDPTETTKQGQDEEEHDDSSGDGNDSNDRADDERVRNTVKSIDEEVDRMTQPSSGGMISQQDRPAPLAPPIRGTQVLKNTVHFDDTIPQEGKLDEPQIPARRRSMSSDRKKPSPDDGIERGKNRRVDHIGPYEQPAPDLLAADNFNKPPNSSSLDSSEIGPHPKSQPRHFARKLHPITHAQAYFPPSDGSQNSKKRDRGVTLRTKRSIAQDHHRQQQQYDQFLVPELEMKSKKRRRKRLKRLGQSTTKRSDDDDDDEEDEEEDSDGGVGGGDVAIQDNELPEQQEQHNQGLTMGNPLLGQLFPAQSPPVIERKQFLTNDPSFEELLAHKQLLDALQQSQLPSPVEPLKAPHTNQRVPGNNSSSSSNGPVGAPKKAGQGDDHQSADTHYSVDHGLLLYPASDEEHHHKSKSHKSSKASKKKEKKKSTVAIKKGGHKSKKHKKEEKKYHKEKKFKGAKKGKKMKKGKGGKGGKKGKKLFKDKGYKKKGFKNTYVKNEFGSKKSYFDEFRDKDFKKKWKNFDDKYNYAQMKKWQAKDVKKAKKSKDHGEKFKKYDKGKWKKKKFAEMSSGSKKSKSKHDKDF